MNFKDFLHKCSSRRTPSGHFSRQRERRLEQVYSLTFARSLFQLIVIFSLIVLPLISCTSTQKDIVPTSILPRVEPTSTSTMIASTTTSTAIPDGSVAPTFHARYAFPDSIDPSKQYMFYLHGKIIEDQGIPAVNPVYGEYEYEAILERLSEFGFVVVSEQRPKNADGVKYANKTAEQITELLDAGVPAKNITVVGASKGSYIAIYTSHFLANREVNFVLLGSCFPGEVDLILQNQIYLFGNVLSMYDSVDQYADSCEEYFSLSKSRGGLSRTNEIVLNIGTGHGILYQPLDEWILPTAAWAEK